jgi:histidinol-phosphatase (PHP family)
MTISDNHVHSQFSWDAPLGDMEATCRRAVELGLPSVAFTEHVDWVRGPDAVLNVEPYFECIERCRSAFPGLRVLSGVEMGEPHLYKEEARVLLESPFERVLASVHCIAWEGRQIDASERGFLTAANADDAFERYLESVLALVESDQPFQVLAHLDYPKRYWPGDATYEVARHQDSLRAVLREAARRDVVLELNTTRREDEPERYLCPGPDVLGWWREEGGRAISFGSDAHSPERLSVGIQHARAVAEAAGFRPQDDPLAFWVG